MVASNFPKRILSAIVPVNRWVSCKTIPRLLLRSCFLDINSVISDFSTVNIIKSIDQVSDRGLPGAGGAHESDFLPGFGIEGNIVEDGAFRFIAKSSMVKSYVSLQKF